MHSGTCASANPTRSYSVILNITDILVRDFGSGNVDVKLQSVRYGTTSVDNGLRFTNLLCSSMTAVTSTSQSWGANDSPGNWNGRCPFNCTVGAWATVTITNT